MVKKNITSTAKRASSLSKQARSGEFKTKDEAIRAARYWISKHWNHGNIVIHGRDGRIVDQKKVPGGKGGGTDNTGPEIR